MKRGAPSKNVLWTHVPRILNVFDAIEGGHKLVDNTPDPTRTHAHFLVSVSHRTHAHSAWLKLFMVKLSASSSLCFTSISFLEVVTQHPSLSVPACFILHHPDLWRQLLVDRGAWPFFVDGVSCMVNFGFCVFREERKEKREERRWKKKREDERKIRRSRENEEK